MALRCKLSVMFGYRCHGGQYNIKAWTPCGFFRHHWRAQSGWADIWCYSKYPRIFHRDFSCQSRTIRGLGAQKPCVMSTHWCLRYPTALLGYPCSTGCLLWLPVTGPSHPPGTMACMQAATRGLCFTFLNMQTEKWHIKYWGSTHPAHCVDLNFST